MHRAALRPLTSTLFPISTSVISYHKWWCLVRKSLFDVINCFLTLLSSLNCTKYTREMPQPKIKIIAFTYNYNSMHQKLLAHRTKNHQNAHNFRDLRNKKSKWIHGNVNRRNLCLVVFIDSDIEAFIVVGGSLRASKRKYRNYKKQNVHHVMITGIADLAPWLFMLSLAMLSLSE